jgi:hypothetical protein
MANPISSLFRKMMKLEILRSPSNRVLLVLGLIIVLSLVSLAIGSAREDAQVRACQERGGTPIYRTKVEYVPADIQGRESVRRDYQVFDRCNFEKI